MKKHMLLLSNMIIILAVVAGFTISVYKDTKSYQQLAEKHLENIVTLANTDISNHIENFMNKPVMVSKTMANDEFLKTWLGKEPKNFGNSTYMQQLYSYLKAYQLKYNYTTVFCVSSKTGNYYYQDGLNKKVSKNDPHDIWYYNFISSGREYDLEVDTNQVNHNNITVFINFRVMGEDGKILGVIGIGLKASFIEKLIHSYEKNYDLSVFIVNVKGAKNSFNGNTDIFIKQDKLPEYTNIQEKIKMNKSDASEVQWFTSGNERKCLITQYNNSLGWYLVLKMETNSIYKAFQERIKSSIFFMLFSLTACILVTTIVFFNYNKRIVAMENTDDLTGLPNRKLFSEQYSKYIKKHRKNKKTLFMLDIDHFKEINDLHGHIFGNAIITMVADKLKSTINEYGTASRWGGDEFIGILLVEPDEAKQILCKLVATLKNVEDENCRVTISAGLVEIDEKLSMEQTVKRADDLLYLSKANGRDRIEKE